MSFPYSKYSELKAKNRIGAISDHKDEDIVLGKIVPLLKQDLFG